MILRITVNDNDFTEYLEQFAEDPTLTHFFCTTKLPEYSGWDTMKKMNHFRELFYSTEKYTPELIDELVESIKLHWELWVKYELQLEEWQDDDTREYLIKNFKVKFQKSLTPKWENGEVVYICCGYYNKWWTF
jgi:hypothetical protein